MPLAFAADAGLHGTSDSVASPSVAEHGRLRFKQGYTAPTPVEESRILQVTIFGTLQNNQATLDLDVVLTDVMTIADEVVHS
jgi:hypothetical protein